MQKIDNPEIEKNTLQIMKEANQPVSCDYVAFKLHVGWGTARGVLLNMALKGKITALKTTKSFIFLLKPDDSCKPKLVEDAKALGVVKSEA
jgi:hypothetical protein